MTDTDTVLEPESVASSQGMDASSFQRPLTDADIAGYDFVIVKATEATSWVDPNFAHNWAFLEAAVKAGKIAFRGAYHFFHPSLNVAAQVALFMATVAEQGLQAGDALVADAEILSGADNVLTLARDGRSHLLERGSNGEVKVKHGTADYPVGGLLAHQLPPLAASAVDAAVRGFLDGVSTAVMVAIGGPHCPVMDYSDLTVAAQLHSCTGYPLWVAYYSGSAPRSVAPWNNWVFWQFAGGGARNGGDQNAFNGTKAQLQAWLAKYKPVPPPPPTPKPALSKEFSMLHIQVQAPAGHSWTGIRTYLYALGSAPEHILDEQTEQGVLKALPLAPVSWEQFLAWGGQ